MKLRRGALTLSLSLLILWSVKGQINAEFTANVRTGCGSFQVSFTDLSVSADGPIVSWSWDLGGVHSSRQNPGRIFGNPGKYKICLQVTDSQGNTATHCEEDYILVYHLPEPAFDVDVREGCSPLMVNFLDQSNGEDSPIKEWIWGMGGINGVIREDGSRPVIPNIYSVPDDYTVSLTVVDENGCLNTLTKNQYITVHEDPIIDFSVNQSFACEAPLEVVFTNESIDPDIEYQWDFGNGEIYVGEIPPPVTYALPGHYSIKVNARNKQTGCKAEKSYENLIQIGYLTEFAISEPQGCAPFEVFFSDQSTEPADSLVWDFGNGSSSQESNPSYVYQNGGCYTVTLTRYIDGCESQQVLGPCIQVDTIAIPDYALTAGIGCELPHLVDFTSLASSGVEWSWDFGDGATSSLANPSHAYTRFGEFPVSLQVTDGNGCVASVVKDTIRLLPLTAAIAPDIFTGCTPLDVELEERSTTITPIIAWDWEVADASLPPKIQHSTDQQPLFTLIDTGRYTIRLIVENQLGCRDTSWYRDRIGVGMVPTAHFSAIPTSACIGTTFAFSDESSAFVDEWDWDFGDGTSSPKKNPKHTYGRTGLFDVSLKASHYECEDQITFEKYIDVQPPMARFRIERDCDRPYEVRMYDQSVGADSLIYYFGVPGTDSDTSTQRNPVFRFPETGTYTISQVVYNLTNGCQDSIFREVIITDPKAQFTIQQTDGCTPLTLDFIDQSEFGQQYLWQADFGSWDDSTSTHPQLMIKEPGAYSGISLFIMDINLCVDSIQIRDTIRVNQAQAGFAAKPAEGCFPLMVNFEDQSTSLFSSIEQWEWDFGMNTSTTSIPSPSYLFDSVGLFDITLSVTDGWGCKDKLVLFDQVEVTCPIANFSTDTAGCTSKAIDLKNLSLGAKLTYRWDFGDGKTSTARSPSHVYETEGIYTICLTVTNNLGCDSTLCKEDYIRIANPQARFSLDNGFASCPPLIVNFQNESINTNTYRWDFGDRSGESNHSDPAHIYTTPGAYDVSLIAYGFGGCRDTMKLDNLIQVGGPIGEFDFSIDSSCVPVTVTFWGSGIEEYDFIWDLGNGQLDSNLQVMNDTLSYTYEEAGILTPQLILVNDDNCQRVIEAKDTLFLASLEVDFQHPSGDHCGSTGIQFLNLTQSSVPIQSVQWTFPQASPSSSQAAEPWVWFDTTGLYDVGLIVDNGFCRDTLYQPDFIEIGEEVTAVFEMSEDTICASSSISFDALPMMNGSTIASWNWDFGDGTQAANQSPEHYFEEEGVFNVKLKITSTAGCQDSVTQKVLVHPKPLLEDQEYPEICQGESLTLDSRDLFDTTSMTWEWAYHPDLSCLDCLLPSVQPLVDTRYYLVIENALGCRDTAVFFIEVGPYAIPDIQLGQDTLICLYDSVLLQVDGGLNEYHYQWEERNTGLSCYDCPMPVAHPLTNTLYTLEVTSTEGCQNRDSIYIEVIDQSHPFAGPDRTICAGDSIVLEIEEGEEPQWLDSYALSCTQCYTPIAQPLNTHAYPVQIRTSDLGCRILDTINITVIRRDEMSAGPDTTLCLGESYILKGRGEGLIRWSPDIGLDQNDILQPEAGPTASTTYVLEVQNGECLLIDSVQVEVKDEVQIWGRDTMICEGTRVQLPISGDALTYHWEPEQGVSQQGIPNPWLFPKVPTTYTVIGRNSLCEPDTIQVEVGLHPLPEATIPPRYYFFEGDPIQLFPEVESSSNLEYQWSPSLGLSCTDCLEPTVDIDTTSIYQLKLKDLTTGCEDSISTSIQQLFSCPQDLINVPNIFTPNQDGVNDFLGLHPSKVITSILTFKIFNRWGELVFETNDLYTQWDGRFRGEILPSGVYVYYLEAICPISKYNFIKAGDITIVHP